MKRLILLHTLLLSVVAHAILDTNNNGLSDLWEKQYNNGNLFPNTFFPTADPDIDGWNNRTEAAAGTDPFWANPPEGIVATTLLPSATTGAYTLSWPTQIGKRYQLQASTDMESWLPVGDPIVAENTSHSIGINVTQPGSPTPPNLFWHVLIDDIDSDIDGLTNNEEQQLGTNTNAPDSDGDGLLDKAEMLGGTNPLHNDSDLDGILDGADFTPLVNNAIADPDGENLPTSLSTSLRGFWDFESQQGSAYPAVLPDRSGSGRHALSYSGGPQTQGIPSMAAKISPQSVTIPSATFQGQSIWTISGWLKFAEDGIVNASPGYKVVYALYDQQGTGPAPQNAPLAQGTILAVAKVGNTENWFVGGYMQTTYFNEYPYSNGNAKTVFNGHNFSLPAGTMDDGKWHHLAVTRSSAANGQKVYFDGSLAFQGNLLDYPVSYDSNTTFTFGALFSAHTSSLLPEAWVDRVRVHSKLLSSAEINSLHHQDIDRDELWDATETHSSVWRDANHDKLPTAGEIGYRSSPYYWQPPTTDTDQDGLSNITEQAVGTDPFDPDTDGDLMHDGWEKDNGLNPLDPADALLDNDTGGADGLTNLDEYRYNTDPKKRDTDGDGSTDGTEAKGPDGNIDTDNGSDPTDSGDNGIRRPADQLVTFNLGVGDRSDSHSEDYVLNVYRIDPGTGAETRIYTLRSGGFGQYTARTRAFRKGDTYSFQIQWMGTNNATGSAALDSADWDYHMVVSPQGADHGGILIDSYDPANQFVSAATPLLDPQDTTTQSDNDDNITDFPNTLQKKRVVFLTIDIDADSDNNNDSALPDRGLAEDQQENPAAPDTSHMGKVLWVNHGDVDADGIPGYGDGILGVTPASPASITNPANVPDSRPFTPVLMEIPRAGIGSAAVFKLEYSGSDPAEAVTTFDSENQGSTQLAAGTLRVWTKDGASPATVRDPRHVSEEGDWLAPNTPFNLSELGDPVPGNHHIFYVEAIRPSQTIAGEKISLWVDPDGEGGSMGWMKADTVAFTNLDFVLNQAGAGGGLTRIFEPKPSTPRPKITAIIAASNLRADATGERILADLTITGSVTGGGAEFMQDGRIDEITLRVNTDDINGDTTPDPVYEIPVTGTKTTTGNFNAPFPFSGTFSHTLTGIPVQEGLNNLRLAAADPFSLADGYANYQLRVMAIQNGIPGAVLSSATLQFTGALNPAAIDQITYTWNSATEGTRSATTLTETGPGTRIFTNPTAAPDLAVSVLDQFQSLNTNQPDTLDAIEVSDPTHFTPARTYQFLKEIDPQTGIPANNSFSFTGSIHESDESSAAEDGYTLDSFTGGAVNEIENSGTAPVVPMVVEVLGPEAILAATTTLQAFGSPGNVAMKFGQKVRDGARYIVTAADAQRTASTFVANELRDFGDRLNSFIEADKEDKKIQLELNLGYATAFNLGMTHGVASGGWEMVAGTVKTAYTIGKYGFINGGEPLLKLFEGGREMIQWRDGVNQQVLTTITYVKDTLLPMYWKLKTHESDVILAMLTADTEELKLLSEQDQVIMSYVAEILPELWKSWENLPAYDQGYYTGCAAFEVGTLVIGWTKASKIGKAGQLGKVGSKAEFITELRAIRFFNSGPGKTAIDKMFELGGFVERLTVTKMCFPAGTPVLTSNGPIAIETLAPGMLVWSRDPETGKTAWKPILDTFTTHPDRFHHLRYRRDSADSDDPNGTISTTGEHPFWIVQLQDFLPASELHPGHILLLANGATATVIAHTIDASSPTPLTAYNIEVADFHTYYAGEDFIHVHNKGTACDKAFSIFERYMKRNNNDIWKSFTDAQARFPSSLDDRIRLRVFNEARKRHLASPASLAPWDDLGKQLLTPTSGGNMSTRLGSNLEKVGIPKPKGDVDAHHIVSWNEPDALGSRNILQNAGIDINEAANGVFLPSNISKASLYPDLGPNHKAIHTSAYYENLESRLAAVPHNQIRSELQKISSEIIEGSFLW